MKKLVVASNNADKIEEIKEMLKDSVWQVLSQGDMGIDIDVEETGETFAENAYLKAKAVFDLCREVTIADDSGLCVDFLGGHPGVHSKRFTAEASSKSNNLKLLEVLKDVKEKERGAKFVCAMACILPTGDHFTVQGECAGEIGFSQAGENGFGYDSLFIPVGYKNTFAQMSPDEKNTLSHRFKALSGLKDKLNKLD